MNPRWNLPLLLILALALLLRCIGLNTHSLWYDEAFAVLFAEKGLSGMLYGTLTPVAGGAADIHPLLYYLTLNGWMSIFGQAPFTVRLWSVLLGVLSVYLLYKIGRLLFGANTGYTAGILAAVFPFHIHYSQETRMYTLLAVLLLLATWSLLKAVSSQFSVVSGQLTGQGEQHNLTLAHLATALHPSPKEREVPAIVSPLHTERGLGGEVSVLSPQSLLWWLAFGVCSGLAMYTQQLAAFYLVALGVLPLFTRRRAHFMGMALGVGIALVIYAPWLVNIPSQLQKVNSYYWVTQPDVGKLFITLYLFLTVYAEIPAPLGLIALMGSMVLVLLGVVQTLIYVRRVRRYQEQDRASLGLVLWLAFCPPLLMWLVSQIQPLYLERSLLTSAMLLYLWLAWVLTRSGLPLVLRWLLYGVVLLQVGIGLSVQYRLNTFPYSPMEQVIAQIRAEWQTGDVLVHQNKLSALPGWYYGRDLPQRYIGDEAGSPQDTLALPTQETLQFLADGCIQSAARDAGRVWFIVYQRSEQQYAASGLTDLTEIFAWLDEYFTRQPMRTVSDLNVYLFEAGQNTRSDVCTP